MFASLKGVLSASLLLPLAVTAAAAQPSVISDNVVRIGVLTDMSGVYSDLAGKGAVEAVKIAAEDFGGTILGKPIEVIFLITRINQMWVRPQRGNGSTQAASI